MLLQQLVAYAERLERDEVGAKPAVPFMYQEQPVRWLIYLDAAGNFERIERTSDGLGKKNDRGKKIFTPHVGRTVGIVAKLLADNGEYVLGIGKEGADQAKVQQRFEAFKASVKSCAETTNVSQVKAVLTFLEELNVKQLELEADFGADDNLTFVVDGIRPIDLPEVQRFWASQFSATESTKGENIFTAECLISSVVGPVMEREPVKIKGIPEGQTSGMNFISANAAAFESYGLSASQIAPVRLDLAEKYANALNRLLKDEPTHLRMGPVVYAFWTKKSPIPPVAELLRNPRGGSAAERFAKGKTAKTKVAADPEQVRKSIKSIFVSREFNLLLEDDFYAVSLSASGSRVVVRDHITTTVKEIKGNLGRYFDSQELIGTEPCGLYALAGCLYRDASKEMVSSVPTAIIAFALKQTPLPWPFLAQLVGRNRAEQRVTAPRAVLTKMVLISGGKIGMDELKRLEPDRPKSLGYHLGRLMALLEDLQYAALGKVNTNVTDRFYGSLSSTPIVPYRALMNGAQAHLSKLRKDLSKKGLNLSYERRLSEISAHLETIPATLDMENQALFSLGYYHQKAEKFEAIDEAKEAKKATQAGQAQPVKGDKQ